MPEIGISDNFTLTPVQILRISNACLTNSTCSYTDMYAIAFNYTATTVMFFVLVAFFIGALMRVIKDAGDD
jgi:hypothetical protein